MGCKCIKPKGDEEIDTTRLQELSKFYKKYFLHSNRQNNKIKSKIIKFNDKNSSKI